MISNARKIRVLRAEHEALNFKQEKAAQMLDQVWEQQGAMANLLVRLQETLRPALPDEAAGGPPPAPAHRRAQVLTVQLDELDRQVEDLARETQEVQSKLYTEPLTPVVRVLDAHASALDAMQEQVGSV